MQATLNIRIDEALKERGDNVLREHGVSTSAAVRALWEQLAASKELPDFLRERLGEYDGRTKRKAALRSLAGIAEGRCSDMTDEEMRAMQMSRYE